MNKREWKARRWRALAVKRWLHGCEELVFRHRGGPRFGVLRLTQKGRQNLHADRFPDVEVRERPNV